MRFDLLLSLAAGATLAVGPAPEATPHRTDVNHSTVGFSVPILGGLSQVTGKFSRFELDFDYDAEEPSRSRVVAVIEAASVDTGIDARDNHLRQEDFFHASEYPEIVFESAEVRVEGDGLVVSGVLTIRDISKDVELKVRTMRSPDGKAVGFHATTSFDRQEFGVHYKHRDIPDFIGDEVTVELHILTHPRS